MFTRLILCFLAVSMFSAPAAAGYRGESPEKMMTLKDFQILGVTIDMPIGDIFTELEAQGHKFECRFDACKVRGNGFEFTLVHTKKSLGKRNSQPDFDRNATPVSIGIGQVTNFSECHAAKKLIQGYCNKDDQKQPCWTNNFGVTNGNISSKGKSPDGFIYSASVMLNPNKTCSVGIKRQ